MTLRDASDSPTMTPFEQAQVRNQRLKAWLTSSSIVISVVGSILAACITYLSAQDVQRQQEATAFELKVAEIVMNARNGWEAAARAKAMATLFPDRVSEELKKDHDPKQITWGRDSHNRLLELLVTQPTSPERRAYLLKTWKEVFPGDAEWLDKIPAN